LPDQVASVDLTGVNVAEGSGGASGGARGVQPGALTALLQEVAAVPGKREEEPPSLPPGTVVGRFEIIRELGRGGFGVVYEAKDRDLGRQVAVKVVRPGRITEEKGKASREAEAIARLAHPNLVTLHDVGQSEGRPFLVFELLRGKTLDLRIEEGQLPVQDAVHIATEIARGLAHAHAEGVIHRDLKPANVFVTNKGQVKILDFGMAHAFGRRRLSGGTPAYMAPEQWEDDPEDERTDVFALGVMLYRMLTGEYPFPEGQGKWAAEAATPRKLDVPGAPELADLVERMLDRTPKGRPRDGAAVLAALVPIEERLRARPADGAPPVHAKRRKATFGDLLAELRRRHVFRVMIGYGVFAFAVLQVSEPIMHGADLPNWVLKAVLAGLVLGFPVAVILAWIFDLTAQGVKRTPSATDPGAPRFGRSRYLLPFAVAIAVLAIATAGAGAWYAWRGASGEKHAGASVPVAGPDGRIMVAVADFVNDTKDPELDGLSGQLITSLEQSQKLRVLTRSRMVDVLRQLGKASVPVVDEVMGREMARAAGVQALVVASIRRFDQLYAIDLKVLDPGTSEYFFTLKEEREGKAAIPGMLDLLSERAREKLRETPAQVAATRVAVADAITASHEAWKHYAEGQRWEDAGDLLRAIQSHEKAVEADPRFAMAHYRIAYLGEFIQYPAPLRNAAMDSAYREIDRVPAKEKMLFRAWKAHVDGRNADAHAIYGQAAADYPLDKEVLYLAGDLYLHEGKPAEALPWFEKAVALDPTWPEAQDHILRDALPRMGRIDEALTRAQTRMERSPGSRSRAVLLSLLNQAGRPEEALAVSRAVAAGDPQWPAQHSLARSLLMAERPAEAVEVLKPFVAPSVKAEDRIDAIGLTIGALVQQGRRREALRLTHDVGSIPGARVQGKPFLEHFVRWQILMNERDHRAALHEGEVVLGFGLGTGAMFTGYLFMGEDRLAEAAAPARTNRTLWSIYESLAAWRKGDPATAIEGLRRVIARDPDAGPFLNWWIAYVAFDAGRDDEATKAMAVYANSREMLSAWRGWGLARLLLKRAGAEERRGDLASARATVEQLLGWWTRADPDLPLLAETKALCRKLGCKAPE
jgi:tetratricopeptide (TPR) repeat protein